MQPVTVFAKCEKLNMEVSIKKTGYSTLTTDIF